MHASALGLPEKPEGSVSGHQELGIVLDGKTLKPGTDVTGTLTVADTASGASYPIKISATVVKAIEYQTHQDVSFITGGGAGAEGPKLVRIIKDPVLNVPVGGTDSQEYLLVSRAKDKHQWKIEASAPWLATVPAAGEIAPGAALKVKIVGKPPDKESAAYDATLTLTAAGGEVKDSYPVKVFVIPSYQAPQPPQGEGVFLNDFDPKNVKNYMCAGFFKGYKGPRPWFYVDENMKLQFDAPAPDNVKRDERSKYPYKMGEKTFTRGVWCAPSFSATFAIEGAGYKAFSTDVGFFGDVKKFNPNANIGAVVNFEIHVDGKARAQSGLMKFGDAPRLLAVTGLENAKELKLVVRRDDMVNDWYTSCTWGDARFIKGK